MPWPSPSSTTRLPRRHRPGGLCGHAVHPVHWTSHPWAIYAVAGLAIACSTFRKGRGNRLFRRLPALLGRRADGPAGKLFDLLAVFATMFGSATSPSADSASLVLASLSSRGAWDRIGSWLSCGAR